MFAMRCRRRPTLPRSLDRSTIGAVGLNDRVRNGNECGPYALVASDMYDNGVVVDRFIENRSKDRAALLAVLLTCSMPRHVGAFAPSLGVPHFSVIRE